MMKAGKAVRTFFEELASKPRVGGLHITDTAVQFMMLERAEGQIAASFALPLPPGIVVGGKLADPKEFERILAELRALIAAGERRGSIRVVASLPPSVTYAQSFTIPNVGPERLPMTADLNVQMISPIAVEEAYMSWHILKETADTYELLGVFAERKVVDAYRSSLEAAGFSPVVFEPQSLSLSWTITDAAGAKEAPLLVLNVTSDGVNMFLLRGGGVFFDYFRSWRSIQDTDTRITTELFYQTLVEEVRKVVNFVFGRFHKTLAYVFLNAPGTEAELKRLIEEKFSMRVVSFEPLSGATGTGAATCSQAWEPSACALRFTTSRLLSLSICGGTSARSLWACSLSFSSELLFFSGQTRITWVTASLRLIPSRRSETLCNSRSVPMSLIISLPRCVPRARKRRLSWKL